MRYWFFSRRGADAGIRTPDLLFTKQLLCQLSYVGEVGADAREPLSGFEPETSFLPRKCSAY
jgi:hypothetical protein